MKKKYSWKNRKLEVRPCSKGDVGRGVFASEKIKKYELLAVFGGFAMTLEEESELPESIKDLAHSISEDFVIGINSPQDLQDVDHFNHSCEPNAGFKGQLFLVAMRNINENEEVCFDYAMTLHSNEKVAMYEMKCLCNSPSCRGTIREDDWKLPELQKKYNGYFQWYIQEKINGNLEKPYILPEG